LFTVIDQDKNGSVELKELVDIFNISNSEEEEENKTFAEKLFALVDPFKKGYMDYLDFATIIFRCNGPGFKRFSRALKHIKMDKEG